MDRLEDGADSVVSVVVVNEEAIEWDSVPNTGCRMEVVTLVGHGTLEQLELELPIVQ